MNKKFLFVGNRYGVLNAMQKSVLQINETLVLTDSYLEHELDEKNLQYTSFTTKEELLKKIADSEFDILVSNGCPFILPVSKIKKTHQTFINIHPSLLPDLKGINPINGAILYDRNAGATCHVMDDGVDTGAIIAQINLGKQQDLGLLYQLSFFAEGKVFKNALERDFKPINITSAISGPIYYSRKEKDLVIDFNEDIQGIKRRIRAFGIKNQGAYFTFKNKKVTVLNAEILSNTFLNKEMKKYENGAILLKYEDSIVVKLQNKLVIFSKIITGFEELQIGEKIT